MIEHTIPNLPARDLDATARFYTALGFEQRTRNDGWMTLTRGPLELEFFQWPALDPHGSIASGCIRVAQVDDLRAAFAQAHLPGAGIPRLTTTIDQPWGWREFTLVDIDGNLLRCLGPRHGASDVEGPRAGGTLSLTHDEPTVERTRGLWRRQDDGRDADDGSVFRDEGSVARDDRLVGAQRFPRKGDDELSD